MKKILIVLILLLASGCFESPAEKAARIAEFDRQLEQEKLYLRDAMMRMGSEFNEDKWNSIVQKFKNLYGTDWRRKALRDIRKDKPLLEQRIELVNRFREAYPDTWQRELLEYDLKQMELERQRQQRAGISMEQFNALQRNIALQNLYEQQNRQPVIISPPSSQNNSTYWQEENARQQWWDRQYKKMGIPRP